LLPALGNIALSRLAPEDLDTLYARLLESGRKNTSTKGPGLSPASVRYVHRVLRKALGDAVRKGTLLRDPAALADPTSTSTPSSSTSATPSPSSPTSSTSPT
jgi:hypothetical protein